MLWGRQELLSGLIKASIKISKKSDENGMQRIVITNSSPIKLKASIPDAAGANIIEIEPDKETAVDWQSSSNTVRIIWENLWISPNDKLTTEFNIGQ